MAGRSPQDTLFPADDADAASRWWINAIKEQAHGDDERLLRLLREHMAVTDTHAERVREVRDAAARRLRAAGVPMTDIANLAGVSDSYLARRLIGAGDVRRVDRRRREDRT